jgi:hypothetical protein
LRESRIASVVVLGLGLFGCVSGPEPAVSPPQAVRPTYELGERWIRNDGIYELTRIQDGRYVFLGGAGREVQLTHDLAIAMAFRGPALLHFSSPPALGWPLGVGQRNTSSGTLRLSGFGWIGVGPAPTTVTVDRYEEVRVPAGTFEAFRITGVATGQDTPLGGHVFRTWYAPEARQLVKGESSTLSVLNFEVVALDPIQGLRRGSLQVILEQPVDQARLTTDRVVVVGKVTGGRGITLVTLTLNAVEVARLDEREQPKTIVRLNQAITLRPGQNVLLITATDATGETHQAARTVFYEPVPKQAGAKTHRVTRTPGFPSRGGL